MQSVCWKKTVATGELTWPRAMFCFLNSICHTLLYTCYTVSVYLFICYLWNTFQWAGEGNGNPLQCSCLENPMDEGAWQATVHRVAKSWTRLSAFFFFYSSPSFSFILFFSVGKVCPKCLTDSSQQNKILILVEILFQWKVKMLKSK